VVLDVGGGPGVYALDLARQGYRVHLIEPVPLHLEQAAAAQSEQPDHPLESLAQGDARALRFADGIADAVLMLGPLYHLSERAERLRALREARRVLRAGGVLCVAAISRFASLLDGLRRQMLVDPQFASIVRQDLLDGRHVNLSGRVEHFTTAYFHRPEELRAELAEVGLPPARIVAVEGPAWLLGNLEAHWRDPQHRLALLQALEAVEEEPALLGASAHILAVARREA
jgi:ubiquinone/menaquinone biosynthesis C-methylase UbiE